MWVGRVRIGDKVLSDDDGVGLDSILQKEYHFALTAKCQGEEEVQKIQKVNFSYLIGSFMMNLFMDTLTKVLSPKIAFKRVRNPSASITVNLVFSSTHLL